MVMRVPVRPTPALQEKKRNLLNVSFSTKIILSKLYFRLSQIGKAKGTV